MARSGERVRLASATGRAVVAAAVLGSALAFMSDDMLNVAIPSVAAELGGSVAETCCLRSHARGVRARPVVLDEVDLHAVDARSDGPRLNRAFPYVWRPFIAAPSSARERMPSFR